MHKIKEMLHKDSEDTNANHSSSTSSNTEHKEGFMEKVKDKLHSDNNDSSSSSHSHSARSSHDSNLKRKEGDILSTREFEKGHMHHGEIEHGGIGHQHQHDHTHEHTHLQSSGEKKLKTKKLKESGEKHKLKEHMHEHSGHSHEKHIMHDREVLKETDLYKSGVDPSMNREVYSTTTHEGGVARARIDEGKIVKETIKEVELHKIQPVVHREREQKEIRHVVEPHKKVEIKDTKIHHRERDIDLGVRREASTLETSRDLGTGPNIESSREFLGRERQHQELPTKVEEHVHRKVEEHIHPVVYKEILKPKVTEETHHIYEKVKEAPIETYEVKEIAHARSMGEGLREAEREFFSRESSRGIVLDEGHSCSRDIEHHHGHKHASHDHQLKEHDHKLKEHKISKEHKMHKKDKSLKRSGDSYTKEHISSGPMMTTSTVQEPIIGHHQNIGAHHLAAGAVPAGHNTAYDAALCNQCTSNAVCSHSSRDAGLMQKMNEKKIVKDGAIGDKQAKKLNVV